MNKKINKKVDKPRQWLPAILLASMLLVSNSVIAGTWTEYYPVGYFQTTAEGYLYLKLDPNTAHPNPDNCKSSGWMRVDKDQANKQYINQMALTALAAGRKVAAYVEGCSGSYVKLQHLKIH